ncbi:MAG: family 43 glycosylhydrolase [Caldilineaceae bacterium]
MTVTRFFKNPVYTENFPDPTVAIQINREGDLEFHAFSTQRRNGESGYIFIPHIISTDLIHWQKAGSALDDKAIPDMIVQDTPKFWAPEVLQLAEHHWLLYFNAKLRARKGPQICVAKSPDLGTPFEVVKAPLDDIGQMNSYPFADIDPCPFRSADGNLYITYGGGTECPVMIAQLRNDGLARIPSSQRPLLYPNPAIEAKQWYEASRIVEFEGQPVLITSGPDARTFYQVRLGVLNEQGRFSQERVIYQGNDTWDRVGQPVFINLGEDENDEKNWWALVHGVERKHAYKEGEIYRQLLLEKVHWKLEEGRWVLTIGEGRPNLAMQEAPRWDPVRVASRISAGND